MKFDPRIHVLSILANTHHSGRGLAFEAELRPEAYRIVVPNQASELVGSQKDGFYAVCAGSGLYLAKVMELVSVAEERGLRQVTHQEVIRAGHIQRIREEGNLRWA